MEKLREYCKAGQHKGKERKGRGKENIKPEL